MKFIGIGSILLCWAGLIFLIYKWKGNRSMTFSQHAAVSKQSQLFYVALFAVVLPLFSWFMFGWFATHLKLPLAYKILMIGALVGQIIAVLVPEVAGTSKESIHRYASFTMAILTMPITALIARYVHDPITKILVSSLALYMLANFLYLIIGHRKQGRVADKNMLIWQATYIAAFHLSVILATFSS